MSEVKVFVELENYADRFFAKENNKKNLNITNHATEALVDSEIKVKRVVA